MLFEPFVGQMLGDDREEVNFWLGDVVENAKIVHAEPILRLAETTEMLDAGLALFAWLVAKVSLDCRSDAGTVRRTETLQVFDGFGCKDDLISHSGQNLARTIRPVKSGS